ncbi:MULTISPECIES: polyphosphate kinase 1 [Acinetobacter]|jgi:polyphosphate kinase|uniref:Polyphosphate kinase n=3 Tax=Acinetobacter junii TaxID=40215 RepID=S7WFP0_ACIJU|nr:MULTISPECIES: polyphosphate kinase 1 [Acinetobacter]ENV49624.1 polyphosphate kinase 1 [Acinetobacter junii CIP 107470 = MTCC 11364]EPR80607.1 Polyphosphate kinase [Acinetobacter junii CIP 107470 = MTCC 11364]MBL8281521.1 polyphosphate kinase 1 [Acinetobacter junii]MCH7305254.1 polyphosphate kinase 1 [Acinetobacter higginsii]MCJ0829875.1 polyphosphate kinase 1 [Acinetobacter sp. NIPH1876]
MTSLHALKNSKEHNLETYINRELSLLEFHKRVLAQAKDTEYPLLERLNFLTIFSRNLDEFFEIRVASLIQQMHIAANATGPEGMPLSDVLQKISRIVHEAVEEQYKILNFTILPQLQGHGVHYIQHTDILEKHKVWIKDYFFNEVQPVVTPISLDPAHPFPRLVNKSLNFIVTLEGKDAFGREIDLAIVPAPRSLPRLLRLPRHISGSSEHYILLSAIIQEHISDLFPGMKATGCYQFRVTRNADLTVSEDVDDLAIALKGELSSRRFGRAVRLEVDKSCPKGIADYLLEQFELEKDHLYFVDGPVNLACFISNFDLPELRFPSYQQKIPKVLYTKKPIFDVLKAGDVLLHHPFDSFAPVIKLLRDAAYDPSVLAIKQTLYRSGADSEIVQILAEAARSGKEVTAIIELRARFDEESNIEVANVLQEAGAVVVYGIVGYKTHAKMILVVRREHDKIKRYVHLGTGNYHATNAKIYTDYGLLTSDEDICEDVHKVFQELTGMGKMAKLKKLFHAPFTLHNQLIELIQQEIDNSKAGKKAQIIIKVNALTEPQLIHALYQASQAGVQIELIIRSICCLRPQVKGLSENIKVRSIVGRYLEHTRVYYFHNDGDTKLFCASADWMGRNLFSRIETCFPIEDKKLKKLILDDGLNNYLKDNRRAWELQADGTWIQCHPKQGQHVYVAQQYLMERSN